MFLGYLLHTVYGVRDKAGAGNTEKGASETQSSNVSFLQPKLCD